MTLRRITCLTPDEVTALTQSPAPQRYSVTELEHYLRDLMHAYPDSTLHVFHPVTIIETSCRTFERQGCEGYIAIIRLIDGRYLLNLLGGTTGYESFYLRPEHLASHDEWSTGWSACAGTPRVWNGTYVPAEAMLQTFELLQEAIHHGPTISFPRPLTREEQAARADLAKQRFVESFRRRFTSTSSQEASAA